MVAIISGNQLGLLNTSAGTLGQQGVFGTAAQGNTKEKVYVNVANGNLVLQDRDDFVVSRGADLGLTRTYNSQAQFNEGNGLQWKLGMLKQVTDLVGDIGYAGSTVKRIDGDGSAALFRYDANRAAYVSTDGGGAYQTLTFDHPSQQWIWRADHRDTLGQIETYNRAGRILSAADSNGQDGGNGFKLSYQYTDGQLTQIVDGSQDRTYFDFVNGNLTSVRTRTAANPTLDVTRARYSYDAQNRLIEVSTDLTPENSSDAKNYWTRYTYVDTSNRVASVEQSDGNKLSFSYSQFNSVWKVVSVTDALSRKTLFDHSVAGQTTVSDPLGKATVFRYDVSGQLLQVKEPVVNGMSQSTSFTYDAKGNVTSMTDARGLTSVYEYDSNGNRVFERDAAGNTVRRSYDIFSNLLLSETKFLVPDPDGDGEAQASQPLTTRFVYDNANRLRFVISPEGRVQEHRYNALGERSASLQYTGSRFNVNFPDLWKQDFSTDMAGLVPTSGNGVFVVNNGSLQVNSINQSTSGYPWARGETMPLGTSWRFEMTTPADLKKAVMMFGLDTLTEIIGDPTYRRLHVTVDTNTGNFLSSAFQGSTSENKFLMASKPNTTYVVEFATKASGEVSVLMHEKGVSDTVAIASHNFIAGQSPRLSLGTVLGGSSVGGIAGGVSTFLFDNMSAKKTLSEADLVTWLASSAVNQAHATRIDYAYDARGQVTSSTSYAKLDSTGNGVLDGTQSVKQYVYDQAGQLLKSIDARGASTSYTYDGLGRVLSSTDAFERQTVTVYSDDGNGGRFTTSLVNGLATTNVYDKAGYLLNKVESTGNTSLSTARNIYDANGRLVRTELQNAQNIYYIYDAAGRKTGEIDQNNYLTEYFYNANDQVTMTTRYASSAAYGANLLFDAQGNPTNLSVEAVRPVSDPNFRNSWNVYDNAGRLHQTIDATGAVKQFSYDGLSRVVKVTQFATRVSLANWGTTPSAVSVPTSVDDRVSRSLYDNDGNLIAELDGDGYLTEYIYNGAGQKTDTIRYAKVANAAALTSGDLAALRPGTDAADIRTRDFHNAKNQVIANLDAEGYLSEMAYDANGNLTSRTRFATKVSNPTAVSLLTLGKTTSANDQTSLFTYTALNQLWAESRPDGGINTYTYDNVGNLISTQQSIGKLVIGDAQANTASGSTGSDFFIGGAGNDVLDGVSGNDVVAYQGRFQDYRFTYVNGVLTVRDVNAANGDEGVDTLRNIKTLRFADRDIDLVDGLRYIASYGDLINAYGTNADAGIEHYLQYGVNEGRVILFDPVAYLNRYDDLRNAYGSNQKAATIHFITQGFGEGREKIVTNAGVFADYVFTYAWGKLTITNKNLANGDPATREFYHVKTLRFKDQEVTLVDALRYIASHAALINAYRTSVNAGIEHFLESGVRAGWKVTFDPAAYLAKYADLRALYGNDLYQATLHYINQGVYQGRNDNGGLTLNDSNAEERKMINRYDVQGRVVAQLSSEGAARLAQMGAVTTQQREVVWALYATTFTYNKDGLRSSSMDPNGNRTLYFYDAGGRPTHVINALGEVTENVYKAFGQVEQVRQYAARLSKPQLAGLTGGKLTQAVVDLIKSIANDSLDSITTNNYDQRGQLTTQTDAVGFQTVNQYNAFGEVISTARQKTDKSGFIAPTTMQYDRRGNLLKKLDFNNVAFTNRTEYDAFGRVTARYDTNGNSRKVAYDDLGRVVTQWDGAGRASSTTYDAFNRVLTETDAIGTGVTTYSYNTQDRSFTITSAEGVSHTTKKTRFGETLKLRVGEANETTYHYDKNGKLLSVTDALGTQSAQDYNRDGQVTRSVDAMGTVTLVEYDAAKRVLSRTYDPSGLNLKTSYTYDAFGMVLRVTDPLGVVTATAYDKKGRPLIAVRDLLGANLSTFYQYDSRGNLLYQRDADGREVSAWISERNFDREEIRFFGAERLFKSFITDGAGNTLNTSDVANRNEVLYDAQTLRRAYNANNQLIYTLDNEGGVTNYVYDNNQRLVRTTKFAATSNLLSTMPKWWVAMSASSIAGSVTSSANDQITRTVYDKDGRVFANIDAAGMVTVNQRFDGEGRVLERVTYSKPINTKALADGLSVQELQAAISSAGLANTALDQRQVMSYDIRGRVTATLTAQGSGTWSVQSTTYDANGNVTARRHFNYPMSSASAPSASAIASWIADVNNRRATDAVSNMSYDKANRLIATATIRHPIGNGIFAWAITAQSYDKGGNVVARNSYSKTLDEADASPALVANFIANNALSSADQQVRFVYDNLGRMSASATAQGVDGNGQIKWAMVKQQYDGANNVIARTAYANSVAATGGVTDPTAANFNSWILGNLTLDNLRDHVTRYAYDGANRLSMTLDASGALSKNVYDALGNLVQTIAYAKPVPANAVFDANYVPVLDSANDQINSTIYDRDNQPVYKIDASGAVTLLSTNALGQVWQEVRYWNRIDRNLITRDSKASDIAALVKADAQRDISVRRVFDAAGRTAYSIDGAGYITDYSYDAMGRVLKKMLYPVSAQISNANLTQEVATQAAAQLGKALVDSYTYDAQGNLLTHTNALNQTESFIYDAKGNKVCWKDQAGQIWNYAYHSAGQLVSETAPVRPVDIGNGTLQDIAVTTTYAYNTFGDLLQKVEAAGLSTARTTVYSYDTARRMTGSARLQKSDGTPEWTVTSQKYDVFGNVVERVNFAKTLATALPVTQAMVSAFIADANQVSANDERVVNAYDKNNRLAISVNNVIDSTGALAKRLTKFDYDAFGNLVMRTENGNVLNPAITLPAPGAVDYLERALSAVQPDYTRDRFTRYAYDTANRMVLSVNPLGAVTKHWYDAVGNRGQSIAYATPTEIWPTILSASFVPVADATRDQVTRVIYGSTGKPAWELDAQGNMLQRSYDAQGNNWKTTRYANPVDMTTLAVVPDATRDRNERVVFDNLGRPQFTLDAAGYIKQFKYDSLGRVTEVVGYRNSVAIGDSNYAADIQAQAVAQTASAIVEKYTYDAQGNVLTHTDAMNQTERFSYDALGRKLSWQNKAGQTWNYAYNTAGQKTREISPAVMVDDGKGVQTSTRIVNTFAYSAFGDLVGKVEALGQPSERTTFYAYNQARQMTQSATTQVKNADGSREWTVTRQNHDLFGNVVVTRRHAKALVTANGVSVNASNMASFLATAGNTSEEDGKTTMAYDRLNRMILQVTPGRDFQGNRRLALVKQDYDAFGNVSQKIEYGNFLRTDIALPAATSQEYAALVLSAISADNNIDRYTRYGYDKLNRMAVMIDAHNSVSKMRYDAFGNRIESTRYATPAPSIPAVLTDSYIPTSNAAQDRVTRTVFDANNRPVLEIDAVGNATQRFFDVQNNAWKTVRYTKPVNVANLPANPKLSDISLPTDAADRIERNVYDALGRVGLSMDAGGGISEYAYNALGYQTNVLRTMAAFTGNVDETQLGKVLWDEKMRQHLRGEVRNTGTSYDLFGNITSSTDAAGSTETATFDALGRKLSFTNKLGKTWNYSYDLAGNLLSELAPQVMVFDNSGNGKLLRVETRMTYDRFGQVLSRTEAFGEPNARTTSYQYDLAGRQIKTILPKAAVYSADINTEAANGATGDAARIETTPAELSITVTYDALGNAIANRDVAGVLSYKAYDRMGRVRYEVDALGYVTGYERNAFGEVTTLTRYEKAPTIAQGHHTYIASIASALNNTSSVLDRVLRYQYDKNGQKVRVIEGRALVSDPNVLSDNTEVMLSKTTELRYNSFGQVAAQLVYGADEAGNAATKAQATYFFFDTRGNKNGQINISRHENGQAYGYITAMRTDALGNLEWQKEYANEVAISSYAPYGAAFGLPSSNVSDRETVFEYDAMNRKVAETQKDVIFTGKLGEANNKRDLRTSYGYDALGNQTKVTNALGQTTYTYYDTAGRVQAVVREHPEGSVDLTAATDMRRDVYGNVLMQVEHARGTSRADASGYIMQSHAEDRVTIKTYDSNSRVLSSRDAMGGTMYFSYDIYGQVAKQWQTVTSTDSAGVSVRQTAFTINRYDSLGRVIEVISPDVSRAGENKITTGLTRKANVYNAFGEVTSKTVSNVDGTKTYMETDYDNVGRAWRSNDGDGVDKVSLFDAMGNVTAQIRSTDASSNRILRTQINSAVQALDLQDVLRTNTTYDLMGRAVDSRVFDPQMFVLQKDANDNWVKVKYDKLKPMADDLIIVGSLDEQSKAIRVQYRLLGTDFWHDTSTARVRATGDYTVFSTAGLDAGKYEYQVMLKKGDALYKIEGGRFETKIGNSIEKDKRVIELYATFLNRAPENTSLSWWVRHLNNGEDLALLAYDFFTGPEATTRLTGSTSDKLRRVFLDSFGRNGVNDPTFESEIANLAYAYEQALPRGKAAAGQILVDMIAQTRKYPINGGANGSAGTDSIKLAAAKRLNNRVDAVAEYFVTQHGANVTRAQAIYEKAESNLAGALADAQKNGKEEWQRSQIVGLYIAMFGYAPGTGALDYRIGLMNQGHSIELMANQIMDWTDALAPQFYPKQGLSTAQYNEQLVMRSYNIMLGRDPSAVEKQAWLDKLNGAIPPGMMGPIQPITNGQFALQLIEKVSSYNGSDVKLQNERRVFNEKVTLGLSFVAQNRNDFETSKIMLSAVKGVSTAAIAAEQAVTTLAAMRQASLELGSNVQLAARATPLEVMRLKLARAYVVLFNRAPDKNGLDYFLKNKPGDGGLWSDAHWENLLNGLLNSDEIKADPTMAGGSKVNGVYVPLTNAQFVSRVYSLAFGAEPTSVAGKAEMAGFVTQLNNNVSRGAVVNKMLDSMLSFSNPSAVEVAMRTLLDNKTAVGLVYATNLVMDNVSVARNVLSKVTASDMKVALDYAYSTSQAAYIKVADAIKLAAPKINDALGPVIESANAIGAMEKAGVPATARERLAIAKLYVGILGRGPAQFSAAVEGDVDAFQYFLDSNGSLAAIADGFILSKPEGEGIYGGLSNAEFVARVYAKATGRSDAGQEDFNYFVQKLQANVSRGTVAVEILAAIENYNKVAPDAAALRYLEGKQAYLNRIASSLEVVLAAAQTRADSAQAQASAKQSEINKLKNDLAPLQTALNTAKSTRDAAANAMASAISNADANGDGTASRRLDIVRLYATLLQRSSAPHISEVNFFVNGGASMASIAEQFITSAEGSPSFPADNVGFINAVYQKILGRLPAPGDTFYLDALNKNSNVPGIRGQIAWDILRNFINFSDNTPEQLTRKVTFDAKINGFIATEQTQAQSAYDSVQAQRQSYLDAITTANNAVTSATTARDNAVAAKNAAITAETPDAETLVQYEGNLRQVAMYYRGLRGYADFGGLAFWAKQGSAGLSGLFNGILDTDYTTSDNVAFVRQLYSKVLGRAASDADANWWASAITAGTNTRAGVASNILNSGEAQSRLAPLVDSMVSSTMSKARNLVNAKNTAVTNLANAEANLVSKQAALASAQQNLANAPDTTASYNLLRTMNALANAVGSVVAANNANSALSVAQKNFDVVNKLLTTAQAELDKIQNAATVAAAFNSAHKISRSTALASAGVKAMQVLESQSAEVGRMRQIVQLFNTILKRAPKLEEMRYWGDKLMNPNYSFKDAANDLMASKAAQSFNWLSMTDDAFVTQVYQFALGRAFSNDPLGKQYWLDAIKAGNSRADVILGVIKSVTVQITSDTAYFDTKLKDGMTALLNEANAMGSSADLTPLINQAEAESLQEARNYDATVALSAGNLQGQNSLAISRLYVTLFGRAPDTGGLAFWLDVLSKPGNSLAAMADGMLTGAESRMPSSLNNQDFVKTVFTLGFGRTAKDSEVSNYTAQLQSNSRGQVLLNMMNGVVNGGSDVLEMATRTSFNGRVTAALNQLSNAQNEYSARVLVAHQTMSQIAASKPLDLESAIQGADSLIQWGRRQQGSNQLTLDRWGNVLEVRDARDPSWSTRYTYNINNQVLLAARPQVIAADGNIDKTKLAVSYNEYDSLGRNVAVTDAKGNTNRTVYDGNGYVVQEIHADGGVVKSTYNLFGNRLSVQQPNMANQVGVMTRYAYDNLGRLERSWKDAKIDIWSTIDDYGQIHAPHGPNHLQAVRDTTEGILKEQYFYDELGRRVKTIDAGGKITFQEYDLDDNVIRVSNEINVGDTADSGPTMYGFTRFSFDAFHRKTWMQDANDKTMTWQYNAQGRMVGHSDLGGNTSVYRYDNAGQLVQQTSSLGQNIVQQYRDGMLVSIEDFATRQRTTYSYDLAGNRVTEKVVSTGDLNGRPAVLQDNRISYDAMNRVTSIKDGNNFEVAYTYDFNGNRVSVSNSNYGVKTTVYNDYDSMNRQTVVNAENQAFSLGKLGHRITYDQAGNRIKDVSNGKTLFFENGRYVIREGVATESYKYDAHGRLFTTTRHATFMVNGSQYDAEALVVDARHYDASGRVRESGMLSNPFGFLGSDGADGWLAPGAYLPSNIGGKLEGSYLTQLQANANMINLGALMDTVKGLLGGLGLAAEKRTYSYFSGGQMRRQQVRDIKEGRELAFLDFNFSTASGRGGYDKAGNLLGYHDRARSDQEYRKISYQDMSKVRQSFESYQVVQETFGITSTYSNYDVNGNRSVVLENNRSTVRASLWYDAQGKVLVKKDKDGQFISSLIANDQMLGTKEKLSENILGSAYERANAATLSSGPSSYSVQSNTETLRSIAKAVWGDSSLWYMLADANGISESDKLTAGRIIIIPTRINTVHNNATTFKPYNAAEAIGDTSPVSPPPPAPSSGGGCGVLGKILVIVVAVVVTFYTAGALSGLGSVLSKVVGAAVGSIASQAVGIAIGQQESFSWKSVALAAVGAGVSAGVDSVFNAAGSSGALSGAGWGATAGRAIISNVVTQGIGVATGLQQKFDWRGVAVAGAASLANSMLQDVFLGTEIAGPTRPGESLGRTGGLAGAVGGGAVGQIIGSTALGFATGVVSSVVRGGKIDFARIATDAFGNALGSGIADSIKASKTPPPITYAVQVQAQDLPQENALFVKARSNFEPTIDYSDADAAQDFARESNRLGGGINAKGAPVDNGSDFNDTVDNWSRQAMGYGENPNAPSASLTMQTIKDGDTIERLSRLYGGKNWRAQQALILGSNPIKIDADTGSPIIHPGDTIIINDVNDLSPKNLALANRIGGEFTKRNFYYTEADAVRNLNAIVNGTQEERNKNPYYQMALNAQKNAPKPSVYQFGASSPSARPLDGLISNYEKVVQGVDSYFEHSFKNIENFGVEGNGGAQTWVAAGIHGGQKIGVPLIKMGLFAGDRFLHATNSVISGNLRSDISQNIVDIVSDYKELRSLLTRSDVSAVRRLSLTYDTGAGTGAKGADFKLMVGNDRIGFQTKYAGQALEDPKNAGKMIFKSNPGKFDDVLRTTYNWQTGTLQSELMLEKNLGELKIFPTTLSKIGPLAVTVVPGLRQNITSNGNVTTSINVDFSIKKIIPYAKVSIEFRARGG